MLIADFYIVSFFGTDTEAGKKIWIFKVADNDAATANPDRGSRPTFFLLRVNFCLTRSGSNPDTKHYTEILYTRFNAEFVFVNV